MNRVRNSDSEVLRISLTFEQKLCTVNSRYHFPDPDSNMENDQIRIQQKNSPNLRSGSELMNHAMPFRVSIC